MKYQINVTQHDRYKFLLSIITVSELVPNNLVTALKTVLVCVVFDKMLKEEPFFIKPQSASLGDTISSHKSCKCRVLILHFFKQGHVVCIYHVADLLYLYSAL